jgi:L-2,4-diaminobutyrate decarboxylase
MRFNYKNFSDNNALPFFLDAGEDGALQLKNALEVLLRIVDKYWLQLDSPYQGRSVKEQLSLQNETLPLKGTDLPEILEQVGKEIIQHSVIVRHPKTMAHFHCNPTLASQIAECLIGITNQSLDSWDESPSATNIELLVIRWLCELLGWGENSSGIFVAGGTMGNQMAVLLARNIAANKLGIDINQDGIAFDSRLSKLCIIGSDEMHFSLERAASLIGLGKKAVVTVPTNKYFQIDLEQCHNILSTLKESGRIPMLIVGMAGTTNQGSIDNLSSLADIARKNDAWYHIDAAHGGALLCSNKYRHLISGIEKADSVTIDPHKLFYQSASCGVFLLHSSSHFELIREHAAYLNPLEHEEKGMLDLVTRSIQTTRRFDALKMYMSFRHMGIDGLGYYIEKTIQLAKYAAKLLDKHPDFELATNPTTNVLLFRYCPNNIDKDSLNQLNRNLQEKTYFDQDVVLSLTVVNQKVYLKACIMNPFTTEKDIEEVIYSLSKKCSA